MRENDLPEEVRRLLDETVRMVQARPRHEMGQAQRRRIYEALRATRRGEIARRWLAILAAEKALPIFESAMLMIDEYGQADEKGMNAVQEPRYRLDAAKQFLQGEITRGMVRQARDEFYDLMVIGLDKRVPYLALSAAYEAMCEATGTVPLQSRISKAVEREGGETEYVSSEKWTDEELAGAGANASDAAVNAAYAYAEISRSGRYDYGKVLEFWQWWLTEAMPEAWKRAR